LPKENFHLLPKIVMRKEADRPIAWKSIVISGKLPGPTIVEKAASLRLRKIKFYFLEILRAGK
jgi:hypothetical protein